MTICPARRLFMRAISGPTVCATPSTFTDSTRCTPSSSDSSSAAWGVPLLCIAIPALANTCARGGRGEGCATR
jgi:hypothetical protein